MSQKQKLIQAIQKVGCKVGIISDSVDYLKDSDIKKIIKDLEEYETTYEMKIKKEIMLIEHETVETEENIMEKDITVKPLSYYS